MNQLISVLTGGGLALVGSALATTLTARFQRRNSRDERLWAKRSQLYVDLLDARESSAQLNGRTQAFASERVRELKQAIYDASTDLNFYADEEGFNNYRPELGEERPEPDEELSRLMRAHDEAEERLRVQIRQELGTAEQPVTRPAIQQGHGDPNGSTTTPGGAPYPIEP